MFSNSVQSKHDVECCVDRIVTASGPPARGLKCLLWVPGPAQFLPSPYSVPVQSLCYIVWTPYPKPQEVSPLSDRWNCTRTSLRTNLKDKNLVKYCIFPSVQALTSSSCSQRQPLDLSLLSLSTTQPDTSSSHG